MLLHSLPSPLCHANEAFRGFLSPERSTMLRIILMSEGRGLIGIHIEQDSERQLCGFQPHRILSQPGQGTEPRPVSGCWLEVSQRKGTDLATRRMRLWHTRLSLSVHIFAYKNIWRAYQSRCFAMNWNYSSQLTENVIANRLNHVF